MITAIYISNNSNSIKVMENHKNGKSQKMKKQVLIFFHF